ncbi:hypothetical protein [Algoriphagus boritolerans]
MNSLRRTRIGDFFWSQMLITCPSW